jgi:hypothetical protein
LHHLILLDSEKLDRLIFPQATKEFRELIQEVTWKDFMPQVLRPRKGILYCGSRASWQSNKAGLTNVFAEMIFIEIESFFSNSNTSKWLKCV